MHLIHVVPCLPLVTPVTSGAEMLLLDPVPILGLGGLGMGAMWDMDGMARAQVGILIHHRIQICTCVGKWGGMHGMTHADGGWTFECSVYGELLSGVARFGLGFKHVRLNTLI